MITKTFIVRCYIQQSDGIFITIKGNEGLNKDTAIDIAKSYVKYEARELLEPETIKFKDKYE